MAYINIEGFDELFKTIDELGDVGNRISTSSLKKAMKPGLDIIKNNAPKDTGGSAKALRIGTVKRYSNGGIQGKMGIDATNWNECKGLWFQHWGYENKGGRGGGYKGKVTKNVGWFNEATDKASDTVLGSLEKEVGSALDKILK